MGKPVGSRFGAEGMQNLGVVNSVQESLLPFVQCKSISVPFTEKRPLGHETGIKYGFEETEPRISVWNIPIGKTGLPFHSVISDVPLLPEIFRWSDPRRCVSSI